MGKDDVVEGKDNDLVRIVLLGVGGCGCNAVVDAFEQIGPDKGIEFVAVNTDRQVLKKIAASEIKKIQIGPKATGGFGAGSQPAQGKAAAEESIQDFCKLFEGAKMVILTAGEGGGTGTGAAPAIAATAKEAGALTIAVVTKPFGFEGNKRMKVALDGIEELKKIVDTTIVLPNERLLQIINDDTTASEAFIESNGVLKNTVTSITDLMTETGFINLDFADITVAMIQSGEAYIGLATAEGEGRAMKAAEDAMKSPLIEREIKGARRVLFNFTGGTDLTLREVNDAADAMKKICHEDASIKLGMVIVKDGSFDGKVRVSVIFTDYEEEVTESGIHLIRRAEDTVAESISKEASAAPRSTKAEESEHLDIPSFLRDTRKQGK